MDAVLKNTIPRDGTFVSLFCGCGGLDLGFIQSGFRCVVAIDNDSEPVLLTYELSGTDGM